MLGSGEQTAGRLLSGQCCDGGDWRDRSWERGQGFGSLGDETMLMHCRVAGVAQPGRRLAEV